MATQGYRVLVTGGAGFIGSALVRHLIERTSHQVLNFDKLTYAGDLRSLTSVAEHPRYQFMQADICDSTAVRCLLHSFRPDIMINLAAESHVDRSIEEPASFVQTNVVGTFTLLTEALAYWRSLSPTGRAHFRFHHVSTDEVFGSLGPVGHFTEETPYNPRSPYSASKASADHLVRAWHHTFGLPILVSYCSNNYGPYQFPEKLIPHIITKALLNEPLPVYGDGKNVRDWLYVDDHVRALVRVFEAGVPGESYVISGRAERTNYEVVQTICAKLDRIRPHPNGRSYCEQIQFVVDRPGHDRRYAINPLKVERVLGWTPEKTFEDGIEATVRWYIDNDWWWRTLPVLANANGRLGLLDRTLKR